MEPPKVFPTFQLDGWYDIETRLTKKIVLERLKIELAGYLIKPGLTAAFPNTNPFDAAGIMYNERSYYLHLQHSSGQTLFTRPDLILQTGLNEVTVVEVKLCYHGYYTDFAAQYSYCVDSPHMPLQEPPLYNGERIPPLNEVIGNYSIVMSNSVEQLQSRALHQASHNADLLKYHLPSVVVKYASVVAVQEFGLDRRVIGVRFFQSERKVILPH